MTTFRVMDGQTVVLETDDWVAAERKAVDALREFRPRVLSIRGTHPTHDWDDQHPRRCRACGGWDNGSYGSHAPCGYEFDGPLLTALAREESHA